MSVIKKILFYVFIFVAWLITTFLLVTSNFFEFNFPMSLMLLPIPFVAAIFALIYLRRK